MSYRTFFNICSCFFLTAFFSFAFAVHSDGLLSLAEVQAIAEKVDSELYPDADTVLVEDFIYSKYEKDGTSVTWGDWVSKVLTEKGKETSRTVSMHYNSSYAKAEFVLVQIIKPNGEIINADLGRQSQEMIDPSQMSSNIYDPNNKILRVTLADLEPGDLIRVLNKKETFKARVPDSFSDYQIFEYSSPIISLNYTIDAPEELPLKSIVLKNEIAGTVQQSPFINRNGRLIYQWEVSNVPQAFPEPAMPPLYTLVQRLLVSTFSSWDEISKWYWDLSEKHFDASTEMQEKVAELVQGKSEDEEKIRSIFRFVSQEIRYMGITLETEAPGYEPHDVTLTFEQRHGVCRDKAALLVVMLRLAGFEAFPVLIHAGAKKDEEVPQPFFNHAIVAVLNADNSYTLMDPTDENTADLLPGYLSNRSYLVARPDGEKLRTSEVPKWEDNLSKIKSSGEIDEKGVLRCSSQVIMEGINDNAYRSMLIRRSPSQREEFFAAVLKNLFPGAKLLSCDILPENLQDTEIALQINLNYEVADLMLENGQTAMLKMPSLAAGLGYVNFILDSTGLEKRRFPFETYVSCGIQEEVKVEIAQKWNKVLALPEFEDISIKGLYWSRAIEYGAASLEQNSSFYISEVEFSPEEYLELKNALKTMEKNARLKVILGQADVQAKPDKKEVPKKTVEEPADCSIISSETSVELEDMHNWTIVEQVKKKVLTYKGLKDNSELKFGYNPAWEDVQLEMAVVRNNSQEHKINENEINIMDASWTASAPRYPASKTLVASLPSVQIGSEIEYRVKRTFRSYPFFLYMHSFRGFDPVIKQQFNISYPEKMKLNWKLYDRGVLDLGKKGNKAIKFQKAKKDAKHYLRWTAVNQEAVKAERGLPPFYTFVGTLLLSSGSWKDYCNELLNSLNFACQYGIDIRGLVTEVEKIQPESRLLALRNFLARMTHHAGPAFTELPLFHITPAERTYLDAYGHSADLAVLHYTVLRALDYNPEFVLVAPGLEQKDLQKFWTQNPSFGLFTEVLVRVKTKEGDYWFNDQDQYGQLGACSLEGSLAYSLQTNKFFSLEVAEKMKSAKKQIILIDMQSAGTAQITIRIQYFGEDFGIINKFYSELSPEEKRRHFQEMLTSLSQSAKALSDLTIDMEEYPGILTFSAKVDDFAVVDENFCYFEFPDSLVNFLRPWGDSRSEALFWNAKRNKFVEIAIRLPSDYRFPEICPEDFSWRSPSKQGYVSIKRLKSSSKNELRYRMEAVLDAEIIAADKYKEILKANQIISHPAARTILLKKRK